MPIPPRGRLPAFLRPLDYAALALSLGIAAGSALAVYGLPGRPASQTAPEGFTLRGDGGVWLYPISASETVAVRGPLGDTVIELRDGAARVVSSPCANQTCVAQGAIRGRGAWNACLPNRVMITVESPEGDNPPDAAAW